MMSDRLLEQVQKNTKLKETISTKERENKVLKERLSWLQRQVEKVYEKLPKGQIKDFVFAELFSKEHKEAYLARVTLKMKNNGTGIVAAFKVQTKTQSEMER
jgi:cob(I)alamin adenosyltransferase